MSNKNVADTRKHHVSSIVRIHCECVLAQKTPPFQQLVLSAGDAVHEGLTNSVTSSRVKPGNCGLIDFVHLGWVQELLCIFQVNPLANKNIEQIWVNVPVLLELAEYLQRLGKCLSRFVRAVFCGQCFEDIGDTHGSGLNAHLSASQPPRITLAVHALVVATGVFRDIFQMLWPRQCFKHLDCGVDVVVNDLAFGGVQRAIGNIEVVPLIIGQESDGFAARILVGITGNLVHPRLVFGAHSLASDRRHAVRRGPLR